MHARRVVASTHTVHTERTHSKLAMARMALPGYWHASQLGSSIAQNFGSATSAAPTA